MPTGRAIESLLPVWEKDRMRGRLAADFLAERLKSFHAFPLAPTLSPRERESDKGMTA